jgi:RNA polymerase sigma factor (sigma-70 family)
MGGVVLEAATVTCAHRPVARRSDHQLVSLVRAGDDRAFEELFARYRRRITAYVYGMVTDHGRAEDIAQEVFVSALRRMRETERPIAFRPWIYEIAKNACIDAHRGRSRAEEVSLTGDGQASGDHLHLVSSSPAPEEAMEVKQRLGHLCGAFGGLSEAHHQILVLRELEGLSYREIGERMGLTRPAVESTLFRARRRLAQEYDELASGARCQRVQAIISSAAGGELAPRERRRMARHVVHCENCRRHARSLGVAAQPAGAGGARRLAGLLRFRCCPPPSRSRSAGARPRPRWPPSRWPASARERSRSTAASPRPGTATIPPPCVSSQPTSPGRRWPRGQGSTGRTCGCRGPRSRRCKGRGRSAVATGRARGARRAGTGITARPVAAAARPPPPRAGRAPAAPPGRARALPPPRRSTPRRRRRRPTRRALQRRRWPCRTPQPQPTPCRACRACPGAKLRRP